MSREVIVILVAQWQTYKLGLNYMYYKNCAAKSTKRENYGKRKLGQIKGENKRNCIP
jgi:hypothetical protein